MRHLPLSTMCCLALATGALVVSGPRLANSETFIGVFGGYQFGAKGTDLTAQEDLGYTTPIPNRVPAAASDIQLRDSATFGARIGHYFESLPGFGVEIEGQYSRPDFKRQNVTVRLTDRTIAGFNRFTMDQLPAEFHMVMGGVNLLYRFDTLQQMGGFKPYVGAGPAIFGLFVRGTGDSGKIVAPAALATPGFINGGDMVSGGWGLGFNAKIGVEVPVTDRLSFDTEYKFTYGRLDVRGFRSFSDIDVNYQAHGLLAGLRYKF